MRETAISEAITIDMNEAAKLSGLSKSKIYKLVKQPDCNFALYVGPRKLLIRYRPFKEYLMTHDFI
ncbi:excisionase [Roseburia hominis]